jgi:uncharacterized protein
MPLRQHKLRHWLMLVLVAALFVLVAAFVDLNPQVDENFFFSSSDPQFQSSAKIDRMFPSGSQVILSVSSDDISSPQYLDRIARLTEQIESIKTVTSVQSLSNGPKNFSDAEKSPFWKRLLISENGRSSNVIFFTSTQDDESLVRHLESIAGKMERTDFRIHIAGAPYVAEMIRRNLRHDFFVFSLTAILLFGLAMGVIFQSAKLTVGMLATCTASVLITLLVQTAFRQRIGILTTNLGTIVFVIALSHMVYMTFNWQRLARAESARSRGLGTKAWRVTLPASFWSMVCASLGFGSLLFLPAKPLRELGIGGVAGTLVACACAYLMYPAFLEWAEPKPSAVTSVRPGMRFWQRRFVWISVAIVLAGAGLSFGLTRLDTDPSLLDYFKKGREPREGLAYVDRNGGSNPLTIVIAAKNGERLDNKDQYEKMWDLQDAFEDDKDVGTVVSLPVLMAEGHRHAFAFLFSWSHLLNIMNEPKHERATSTFITRDRTLAAFYFRMREQGRTEPRVDVVNHLRRLTEQHGFKPVLVGGVYELQGELAKLVASSLMRGVFSLMALFTAVAWIVGKSVRVAAAIILSLAFVPVYMLGAIGWLHVPVDFITLGTNVCIGMAIDSMLHLVFGVRRAQRNGKTGWSAWVAGREEQWRGIVYSDVIIAAGFAIFAFSNFPPTQRFGLVVVCGTIVDIGANLFLLPLLAGASWKKSALIPLRKSVPSSLP